MLEPQKQKRWRKGNSKDEQDEGKSGGEKDSHGKLRNAQEESSGTASKDPQK